MSMKKKLDDAYHQGITKERARILWLMEDERAWLRKQLDQVLLIESKRHAMQIKVKIAVSIYEQLKMRIVTGHEAPGGGGDSPTEGLTDVEESPDNEGADEEPQSGVPGR